MQGRYYVECPSTWFSWSFLLEFIFFEAWTLYNSCSLNYIAYADLWTRENLPTSASQILKLQTWVTTMDENHSNLKISQGYPECGGGFLPQSLLSNHEDLRPWWLHVKQDLLSRAFPMCRIEHRGKIPSISHPSTHALSWEPEGQQALLD